MAEIFSERIVLRQLIATAILILALVFVRGMALRVVRRAKWASESILLRWTIQVRWASVLLLLLGLVIIWSSELRTLAISVVAIAAAVVIATKELIMCVSGSVLRATAGAFSVGDRIEINGIRGDVIDLGALTTTILEIGPTHRRTGREVVIPNSLLFTVAITNESTSDEYVLHTVTVPVTVASLKESAARLLAAGTEICQPVLDEARQRMGEAARRHSLPLLPVEPVVSLQVPEPDKLNLLLRVPTRTRDKGQTEQQILRRFFDIEDVVRT